MCLDTARGPAVGNGGYIGQEWDINRGIAMATGYKSQDEVWELDYWVSVGGT